MIVFTVVSPIAGLLLDKYGVRIVFGVGAVLVTIGLLLSSQIQSFFQLVIAYGLIAGTGIAILGLGMQAAVIARWFKRQRGLAIGIAFAGTGIGSLVLIPGVSQLVVSVGWRGAYAVLAGCMAALIVPIVLWLRLDPTTKGQFPDGEPPAAAFLQADQVVRGAQPEWGMGEVLRTSAFWLVIVAGIGAIGPLRMLSVHQLPILYGAGVPLTYGSRLVGVAGAITAVTFILSGALSDKIGRRATYILGSFSLLAAFFLIASISDPGQTGRLWLYALCLGMGEGSRSSLVSAVASDLFAGKALGGVNGAVGASYGAGAAVFPWLAGRWFDVTGNYNGIFLIAAVAVVLSAVALWVASEQQGAGETGGWRN